LLGVKRQATLKRVRIRAFAHKGLKRLYLEDSPKGLPGDAIDKLRKILAFLQDMEDPEELRSVPIWKAHTLKGGRKGVWSLYVTRNWHLTFQIDAEEGEIYAVNFEDYH
jgi:proteic killer suppression protein